MIMDWQAVYTFSWYLFLSLITSTVSSEKDCSCNRSVVGIGCYNDSITKANALPDLILTDRDPKHQNSSNKSIDWNDWDNYMSDLVCRCAETAKANGYKIFGIQHWGECWGGSEEKYALYGPSTRCATYNYETCTDPSNEQCCVGKINAYYVYKVEKILRSLNCQDNRSDCPTLVNQLRCREIEIRRVCQLSCQECQYQCAIEQEEFAQAVTGDHEEGKCGTKMMVYLSFESGAVGNIIMDDSLNKNHGILGKRALIVKINNNPCGQTAFLFSDDIQFKGDLLKFKPLYAMTVAMWVRVNDVTRNHVLFVTKGEKHECPQYLFQLTNGGITWMHRNEYREIVFRCSVSASLQIGKWFHIAGVYNSLTGLASVYVDGVMLNSTMGSGKLSQDWAKQVSIGDTLSGRAVEGMVDEFRIYNYALSQTEMASLVNRCRDLLAK